jgi:serine/threonine protein kinase
LKFFVFVFFVQVYMAPEVMLYRSATQDCYSFSADIWSAGCVVIEMWTGMRPWWPLDPPQVNKKD